MRVNYRELSIKLNKLNNNYTDRREKNKTDDKTRQNSVHVSFRKIGKLMQETYLRQKNNRTPQERQTY